MTTSPAPFSTLTSTACGLCGRRLYPEEIHSELREPQQSAHGPLCGACRRAWMIASEENIIEHFASRLRQRGHTVEVRVDGRLI
jgi:hypothetical protein